MTKKYHDVTPPHDSKRKKSGKAVSLSYRAGQLAIISFVAVGGYFIYAQVRGAVTVVPSLGDVTMNKTVNPSAASTLADGLTGWWTADGPDVSGTTLYDKSGNGRDGTLISVGYPKPAPTVGKLGQALYYAGGNGQIGDPYTLINVAASTFITASEGTISVWFRPTSAAPSRSSVVAGYAAVGTAESDTKNFGVSQTNVGGEDKIWVWNYSVTPGLDSVAVDYTVGEWVHIMWVHSNGTLYAYKNGELAGSTASADTSLSAEYLKIGRAGWYDPYHTQFRGDIDDVRIWNRGLSASEIKQVYNIGAGQTVSTTKTPVGTLQTGLVGHWTFDGKDMYSNVADVSGNGNNGTLSGFTSTTTAIGKIGQALTFDGVDDYVDLGNDTALDPGTGDYSVSFWYKGLGLATETFLGTWSVGSYFNISDLTGSGSGSAYFTTSGFFENIRGNFTLPVDNDWHHLVVILNRTPDPDTISAYLDGQSLSVTYSTQNLDGQNVNLGNKSVAVGVDIAAGDVTRQGPMDDVRIYNRALSAGEVLQLYNLGK